MRVWFALLFSTICLEGLGRRYLPIIPPAAFYFLKDLVLLFGYVRYRPDATAKRVTRYLYRGFGIFWAFAFGWTVLELGNPELHSAALALIGLRSYWLWWIAPPLIGTVLQNETSKRRGIQVLLVMATGVSLLAIAQFAAPPTAAINMYSVVDGEEVYADTTAVVSTGRARVASTFSFLTGFQDFTLLVPTLLLSIGLDAKDPKLRRAALAITMLVSAVLPMSGSRSAILLGAAVLGIAVTTAGVFFTRAGRRILIGAVAAAILAVTAFPDAFAGIESRFADQQETESRYEAAAMVFPPVALVSVEYPALGIGTGTQQNARFPLHIPTEWNEEYESGRYLVELGAVGFLLVWMTKLGLIVALIRSYRILKQGGRRGAAAAALSYALLTMNGNLTFDHIWQALYFTGVGFILGEVIAVMREQGAAAAAAPPGQHNAAQAQVPADPRVAFRGT